MAPIGGRPRHPDEAGKPGVPVDSPLDLRGLRAEVARLHQRNATLTRAAAAQDAQRQAAEDRSAVLEDLDRIKDEFIATASHELQGPLAAILRTSGGGSSRGSTGRRRRAPAG